MLSYITTALARYVAVGSGESREDCQGNLKSKKQKVITLRRELTLLSCEPQPHHPFQLFGARATHTPEQTQSAVLPMPRVPTGGSRANH